MVNLSNHRFDRYGKHLELEVTEWSMRVSLALFLHQEFGQDVSDVVKTLPSRGFPAFVQQVICLPCTILSSQLFYKTSSVVSTSISNALLTYFSSILGCANGTRITYVLPTIVLVRLILPRLRIVS
jgi:hypothetical protein